MKGKNYSIPYGMVFKKYYCSKCGMELEKERTHRVVSKDDKDDYQYHDHGTFPRSDYDVYDYRFKCPSCNTRISFEEQCIIERIQKKSKRKILSSTEIKDNYKKCKTEDIRRTFWTNLLISNSILVIVFLLYYFLGKNEDLFYRCLNCFFVLSFLMLNIGLRRKYNGKSIFKRYRTYSYEEKMQLKKLHAYSSHNKELIITSEKCYCFYCQKKFNSSNVKDYIDDGQTALCPNCEVDAVLPDNIEGINEEVIEKMNKYWF